MPLGRQLAPALAAAASLAACDDLRPLRPLSIDLTVPVHQTPDRVPLAPVDLASQSGLDAFEARWLPRPGASALADFFDQLASPVEGKRPSSGLVNPLLLQRLVLLRADVAALRGDGLEGVIRAGTRLREAAPGAPDTLFVEGYIPWRFLRAVDDLERPLKLSAELVPFAESVRDRWTQLLALRPDYKGPRGRDATWLRQAVAVLEAALATRASTHAVVPPPPAAAPPPLAVTTLTPAGLAAVEALARFDAAADGERRGLCASWKEHLARPEDRAASPDAAALALRCASLAGEVSTALSSLAALVRFDEGSPDACSLREGLVLRFGETVVEAESKKLGLAFSCLKP